MLQWRRCLLCFLPAIFTITAYSQHIDDSLINRIAKRFEKQQHLTLQKIIQPVALHGGEIPDQRLPCYSGRQVTIVAVYNAKPKEAYGRMLVMKRFGGEAKFDEHFFQAAGYDENFKVNYTLLSVYFPPEATFKNCNTVVQVYDKQKPSNKVWLVILTK